MSELSELFDRDPLNLTEQNITTIVARMREAQAQFELGIKAPVAPRAKKASAKADLLNLIKDITDGDAPASGGPDILKDLGLK